MVVARRHGFAAKGPSRGSPRLHDEAKRGSIRPREGTSAALASQKCSPCGGIFGRLQCDSIRSAGGPYRTGFASLGVVLLVHRASCVQGVLCTGHACAQGVRGHRARSAHDQAHGVHRAEAKMTTSDEDEYEWCRLVTTG